MAWLNFSVTTIWSAMTPAGGMLPTGAVMMVSLFGDIVGVSFGSNGVSRRHRIPAHGTSRNSSWGRRDGDCALRYRY